MSKEIHTFQKQIGELVTSVRALKKLSIRQFAILSGVSTDTISTLEANGQTQLSSEELAILGIRIVRLNKKHG